MKDFGIVYDGPIISDPSQVALLAICYGKIYLPHLYQDSKRDLIEFMTYPGSFELLAGTHEHTVKNPFVEWEQQHSELFNEHVIERLRAPSDDAPPSLALDLIGPTFVSCRRVPLSALNRDMQLHLQRTDLITIPHLADFDSYEISRTVKVATEARAAFRYLLPKLKHFHSTIFWKFGTK
jgi:hypothetical protein